MNTVDLLDRYGVPVALIVIVTLGLLPAVRDKLIPAWIALLTSESEFRRKIELERLESAKRTDESIAELARAMIQTNERMLAILNNQTTIRAREDDILNVLNDAITSMRERVADREGYQRGKKEHKQGDTGPLEAQG